MDSKAESLQIAQMAVQDWRNEEAQAADGIAMARENAIYTMRKAVQAGNSQSAIAEACGWSKQRVSQLLG